MGALIKAIVTVDDPQARLEAVERFGRVVHVSRRSKSIILEATEEDLKRLTEFPWVVQIAVDRKVKLQQDENQSGGGVSPFLTNFRMAQLLSLDEPYNPIPVKVAVIDTGIYDDKGLNVSHLQVIDNPTQKKEHGTWIAYTIGGKPVWTDDGLVSGVIPGIPIIDAPVINEYGYTTLSTIIQALDAVADAGAQVINMSLSSPSLCTEAMNNMLKSLAGEGILMAVAGGNYGNNAYIGCPANSPYTIAVGSVYYDRPAWKISDFSPIGVDITAPGGNIDPQQYIISKVQDKFIGMAGTSMATPYVTSMLAIMKHLNPVIDIDSARYVLAEYSLKPVHVPNPLYGYGIATFQFIKKGIEVEELNASPFYPQTAFQTNPLIGLILTVGLTWAMLKPPKGW